MGGSHAGIAVGVSGPVCSAAVWLGSSPCAATASTATVSLASSPAAAAAQAPARAAAPARATEGRGEEGGAGGAGGGAAEPRGQGDVAERKQHGREAGGAGSAPGQRAPAGGEKEERKTAFDLWTEGAAVPASTAAPAVPVAPLSPCDNMCTVKGLALKCGERILAARTHKTRKDKAPCKAAHAVVMSGCSAECGLCSIEAAHCKDKTTQEPHSFLEVREKFEERAGQEAGHEAARLQIVPLTAGAARTATSALVVLAMVASLLLLTVRRWFPQSLRRQSRSAYLAAPLDAAEAAQDIHN